MLNCDFTYTLCYTPSGNGYDAQEYPLEEYVTACETGWFHRTLSMLRDERHGIPMNGPLALPNTAVRVCMCV